jgi:hypothetical protein
MRILFILFLSLSIPLVSISQVKLEKFEKYDCLGSFDIGYDFGKSYASPSSAGITIFDKTIEGDKLEIFVGFYGNCAEGTTYGVEVKADTIVLLYGLNEIEQIDENGEVGYEIEIDMCECCLNFKYYLNGLNPDINYLIKLKFDMKSNKRSYNGNTIDVVNNLERSIYYSSKKDIKKSLPINIENAITEYSKLLELYKSLNDEIPDSIWFQLAKQIDMTWPKFLTASKAVTDPFVKANLKSSQYKTFIDSFNNQIANLRKSLNKEYERLSDVITFFHWQRKMRLIIDE